MKKRKKEKPCNQIEGLVSRDIMRDSLDDITISPFNRTVIEANLQASSESISR